MFSPSVCAFLPDRVDVSTRNIQFYYSEIACWFCVSSKVYDRAILLRSGLSSQPVLTSVSRALVPHMFFKEHFV